MDSYNLDIVLLPTNCTDGLQPLDLSINKTAKDCLRLQFQEWYAKEIHLQLHRTTEVTPIDLKLSVIKPLSASWIDLLFNYTF